jgi:hypothetical protein
MVMVEAALGELYSVLSQHRLDSVQTADLEVTPPVSGIGSKRYLQLLPDSEAIVYSISDLCLLSSQDS